MILEDARPYVARVFGDEALQFVWLSLKDTAGRVAQNCVHALAEGWREERMKRELFALNDHLLKVIGIDIGKNSFHVIGQPYDKRPRHSPSAARRRPIPCRSCSCRSPNRSAPASSKLGGKLHRQIAGLGALQDFDHVVGGAAKILGNVDPVADFQQVAEDFILSSLSSTIITVYGRLANCVNRGQSRRPRAAGTRSGSLSSRLSPQRPLDFRYWHEADISRRARDVRFRRQSGQAAVVWLQVLGPNLNRSESSRP